MTEKWMRHAKTPETRAGIRRWSRWSDFFFWVGVLLVLGGIVFVVWSVVTVRHNGPVFWWSIAVTAVLVLVCTGCGSYASGRLSEARFADGQVSVGTVEEVIKHTGAEGPDTCDIVVSASLSGTVIHRKIDGIVGDSDVGDRIRFRHNTLDSEDLDDVLFDGWYGPGRHRGEPSWSTRQSPDLYADAQVSVGRVNEVTSHPGFPGGNQPTDYTLMVSVELPGSVTLRRQIYLAEYQLCSSGPAFRSTVRLRHNTVDPENLSDAFFDGWVDEAKGE